MGRFKNLFSKKDITPDYELDIVESKETGYISNAEHLANVVSAGLERENYVAMNRYLASAAQQVEKKDPYVFEHPGVISRILATAFCGIISIVSAYYLFIGASTILLSSELVSLGVFFVAVACIMLAINIPLIYKLIKEIQFKTRFDIYEEFLGYKSLEYVVELAENSKFSETLVINDLQRAIKNKLIPQGHFSRENCVFMVSNEAYERYMEKPAAYDRYFQKVIEERRRVRSRPERIAQIMESGNHYIEKINGYSTLVKEKHISQKIRNIEKIVAMIFYELDANPEQAHSLGVFLNYYLPTTERLLDSYVSLEEKQLRKKIAKQTKNEIETAINTITIAFEGILAKMYEEQEMEIGSDIETLELSMKQEGLLP